MNVLKITQEDFIKILIEKRWVWHFLFWLLYFSLEIPPYFSAVQPDNFWKLALIQDSGLFFLTYSIVFVLFPFFYNKKKQVLFIFSILINASLINFVVSVFTINIINEYNIKVSKLPGISLFDTFIGGISIFYLFSVFIVISKIAKKMYVNQYYENQKKELRVLSELNNLKAQLSPHFLFNTMNNFYGLAVDQSNKLPELMLRLSDLMRYSLYETKNETVSLESEVNFLINYIELEKIRLEDTLQLSFDLDRESILKYSIAPLLLIVFVENAFKHSRNSNGQPVIIKINLHINSYFEMSFKVENNYSHVSSNTVDGGLGIENVKKRLKVLYPENLHQLEIYKVEKTFFVDLKLQLK